MRKAALMMFATAFAGSFTFGLPQAWAQPDHLQCHKVKDTLKFKGAVVDLEAIQAQFQLSASCEIKGRATKFCVPVSKAVVDPGDSPGSLIGPGNDLSPNDYVCYKLKCPQSKIGDTLVTDQFGERVLEKIKFAQELCVPAVKGVVAPPECPLPFTTEDCLNVLALTQELEGKACLDCISGDEDAVSWCIAMAFQPLPSECSNADFNEMCADALNAAGCGSVCCP